MKKLQQKIILLLIICTANIHLFSQIKVDIHLRADSSTVKKYKRKYLENNKVFLPMFFGTYKILETENADKLRGQIIEKIELYDTDYPKNQDLSLLNKKRLFSLFMLIPWAFDNDLIKWEYIKQTGAKTSEQAAKYFHGFVITYRPASTASSIIGEKEFLKNVISGKEKMKDSTIFKIFNRHKKWDKMAVVCDFTGSMSPYVAEILLWHVLTSKDKRVKSFTFFNDGDQTPDNQKIVGKTGGIYSTDNVKIDTILNTALTTISNGYGGDSPENDVEAIISTIKKYPDSENIILIADNLANMRDTSLISLINKPVKVILCGTKNGVNTQFLQLAFKTKGSIHTIEDDIEDMSKINDGETFIISGKKYKLQKDKFILIN